MCRGFPLAQALHTPTHIAQSPPVLLHGSRHLRHWVFLFLIKKQSRKMYSWFDFKKADQRHWEWGGGTAREQWGALAPRGPKGWDHAELRGGWQCRVSAHGVGLRSPLSTACPMLGFYGFFHCGNTSVSIHHLQPSPPYVLAPQPHFSSVPHPLPVPMTFFCSPLRPHPTPLPHPTPAALRAHSTPCPRM